MLKTKEWQATQIPLSHINLKDRTLQFRSDTEDQKISLKAEIEKLWQLHPVTLEEISPKEYVILDGFRRCDAIDDLHKSLGTPTDVLAHIIPSQELTLNQKFQILKQNNLAGENKYGLHARAKFLRTFIDYGFGEDEIAKECAMSPAAIAQSLDVLKASPSLAILLNQSALELPFAAELVNAHQKWIKSAHAKHADLVARRILAHAKEEKMTPHAWKFYLEFYWGERRPFLTHPRNRLD